MMDAAATLIASIVSSYWLIVFFKSRLSRMRHRKQGALIPRLATERQIWPIWVVAITGWHALPMIATTNAGTWYSLPGWALAAPWQTIRLVAAGMASVLFAATIYCWIAMGRHWSVAVIPGELKTLVTNGPFRIVRHPIYSLSIQLMLCSLVVVPNLPMLLVALTHIRLMRRKVQIEEEALSAEFGETWKNYAARTGKFLPRWISSVPFQGNDATSGVQTVVS